ncbi:MAG: BamA/TamA family outer membrane protein [Candidatus Binatia bacterium]|nr:BamA/TamA family outer membrane protein [Candidatus Binatia bacterium]
MLFSSAAAIERLEVEQAIAQLLPQDRLPVDPRPDGTPEPPPDGAQDGAPDGVPDGAPAASAEADDGIDLLGTRSWALLPQVGFGPATGILGGVKFVDRNLLGNRTTFDIEGFYSQNEQNVVRLTVATPPLLDDQLLILFRGAYEKDPQRRFWGLGNNDQGPEPASVNGIEDIRAGLTFSWRPIQRLSLNVESGWRRVNISDGNGLDDLPFTTDEFPALTGIEGGDVSPLALSLVWTSRDDIFNPTEGWRLILKALHTNRDLGSDFEYTQFIGDLGFVYSFFDDNLTLAARANGEQILGPDQAVPYWEMAELGGDDTLRGFFPHRFYGTGRVVVNTEVRFPIADFDFFNLWRVRIGGVAFGDTGRVFISDQAIREEEGESARAEVNRYRWDYGGGVRISLSEALVARIDVGFSEEETALVYLAFGQTF